jgi:phosphatidylserine decarboxylase
MTKVYDRKLKEVIEIKYYGGNILDTIYKHKILTKIVTWKPLSTIYGSISDKKNSKKRIDKFIKENDIDMSLYEDKEYETFNDFFIRKKKKYNISKEGLISPVDGKLLAYKISNTNEVVVKDIKYTLKELFNNEDLEYYKDGYMLVYRLSIDNYHRFHYIDSGKRIKRIRLNGKLHTVSSSSDKYKIYKENEREYSILETDHLGKIIYMEVGALLVGKIINYDLDEFKRGEEKGYFLPGGSTVIIIVNNVKIDDDIIEYSNKGIETLVEVGEKVGDIIC